MSTENTTSTAIAPQQPSWYDREGKPRFGMSPDALTNRLESQMKNIMSCLQGMEGIIKVVGETIICHESDPLTKGTERQFADYEWRFSVGLEQLAKTAIDGITDADNQLFRFKEGKQ